MNIRDGQKTTKLGTNLKFEILDMRGKNRFPDDQTGFVFVYKSPKNPKSHFIVRSDNISPTEWRIDLKVSRLPAEAVYGPNREAYFETNEAAAKALEMYINGEYTRGTLLQIATP